MSLLICFGFPGTGKSYVGKILGKDFGYHYYDGDQVLPPVMRKALEQKLDIPDSMVDDFLDRLIDKIKQLAKLHTNLVISQTFIYEKHRLKLLSTLPNIKFLLITTPESIREERLAQRKEFPIERDYAKIMCEHFDKPNIPHIILDNTQNGEKEIKKQLQKFLLNLNSGEKIAANSHYHTD